MAEPLTDSPLHVRWLGRVPYREALAVQTALFEHGPEQHLLLLEHPHVFTHGTRADLEHNLQCEPAAVGAELVPVKRGGDITYHGPGQLVGYPILNVDNRLGAATHVCGVEGLLIDALARTRPAERRSARRVRRRVARRRSSRSGVVPRKIAAIGVRLRNGRTMHGFALNVTTDMHLPARAHRAVRHRRPAGHVARRGGHRRDDGTTSSTSSRGSPPSGGPTATLERQDVAWRHPADDRDLSAFSRGDGPG